jgi:predicted MFS family arabinose efflux permease
MVVGLICEICAFSHFSALPLFAQQVLRVGPEGLGMLNGAGAIGGAISVALLALLPERMPRKPLLAAIFLAYGISITIFATTQNLLAAAALLLVTGFCAGAFDVLQQTLMQMAVPPEQRGRAVGLWVLSLGSAPVGHLEMGALAGSLGVPAALLLNGLITIASAVALLVRAPEYRWRRRQRTVADG